jgi:hypothetical protein
MARPHSLPPKSHHQSRLTVEATDNQGHARITANASVVRTHDKTCAAPAAHSESASNLLIGNGSKFADFSVEIKSGIGGFCFRHSKVRILPPQATRAVSALF